MNMMMMPAVVAGTFPTGFDIMEAARGDAGYSPVCHVSLYTPDDGMNPKTDIAQLSTAEQASAMDGGFTYCFQTM
jgi:hypothetical protein